MNFDTLNELRKKLAKKYKGSSPKAKRIKKIKAHGTYGKLLTPSQVLVNCRKALIKAGKKETSSIIKQIDTVLRGTGTSFSKKDVAAARAKAKEISEGNPLLETL